MKITWRFNSIFSCTDQLTALKHRRTEKVKSGFKNNSDFLSFYFLLNVKHGKSGPLSHDMFLFLRCCFPTQLAAVWGLCWNICIRGGFVLGPTWMQWSLLFLPIVFASPTWLHLQVLHLVYLLACKPLDCVTHSHCVCFQVSAYSD